MNYENNLGTQQSEDGAQEKTASLESRPESSAANMPRGQSHQSQESLHYNINASRQASSNMSNLRESYNESE